MKEVRILKNGIYRGIPYHKGEIWDYVKHLDGDNFIVGEKNGDKVVVSISDEYKPHGKEAEIIEHDNLILIL